MRSINGSLDRRIFTRRLAQSRQQNRRVVVTNIHKYIYICFVFVYYVYIYFLFSTTVLCHYYYPETLRAAGNSKSLKVIRSDLINEFYYLAVMRAHTPVARVQRDRHHWSHVHKYIYITWVFRNAFRFTLRLVFFSFMYLFILTSRNINLNSLHHKSS